MKALTKNVYYHYDRDGNKRIWHDCKKYKGIQERRIELAAVETSKDETVFKCPHCDFVYTLDNYLELKQSK
jgi:hypothetical protein